MKRVIFVFALLATAACLRAQDSSTAWRDELTENYKKLKGSYEDLQAASAAQAKLIRDLQSDIDALRKQAAKPSGNFATEDELKALTDAVKEVDQKRQEDVKKILDEITKQINKLGNGKTMAMTATSNTGTPVTPPHSGRSAHADVPATPDSQAEDGFNYVVQKGDYPGRIARKLLQEKGIKVTGEQILAANPSIKDPTKMQEGQTIFIPNPKAVPTAAGR